MKRATEQYIAGIFAYLLEEFDSKLMIASPIHKHISLKNEFGRNAFVTFPIFKRYRLALHENSAFSSYVCLFFILSLPFFPSFSTLIIAFSTLIKVNIQICHPFTSIYFCGQCFQPVSYLFFRGKIFSFSGNIRFL